MGLVDYISMDIKSDVLGYKKVSGTMIDIDWILKSIAIIKDAKIPYEFRTTIIPKLITEKVLINIGKLIEGADNYTLQQFSPLKCLDAAYEKLIPYPYEELERLAEIMRRYATTVIIKNIT